MKWSIVRPKVLSVIGTLSGIETYWRDRERPFVAPGSEAICLLHTPGARNAPGEDDYRQEYNEDTDMLDLTQAGIRLFTVSVLVESYNQADSKTALEYIEDIRDGLDRPQISAELRSVNLAVRNVSETRDLAHTEDDHQVSSAQIDVFFAYGNNHTSSESPPGLEPITFIQTIELDMINHD